MHINEVGTLYGTHTCLWEAIVHCATDDKLDGYHGNAYEELQKRLGESACLSWQEIGITPGSMGWHIHINACNESGRVEILIPKDRNAPVQILEDTRAASKPYEMFEYEGE